MNEYAKATGRGNAPSPPAPLPLAGEGRKKLRELSDEEKQRVACTKLRVELHLPEAVPFIGELYELGMIDGYRAVRNFRFEEKAA